ncbi:MAG: response regulator [Nitrospirales bacterium]|nr:response regulator [Nitrospirales bacterium]
MSKILVVDDEKNILKLYQTELMDVGYEVITAGSGKEAIEVFERESPDLVTLDIQMPGMDGIEVLRKLKELRKDVPIIMLTAFDYRDDFGVWSAEAYVVKTSDPTELKKTINNLLKEKGLA